MADLKNDYRDELAKKAEAEDPIKAETERVGKAVMMDRDTFCTMRQLQVQKQVMAADFQHLTGAIGVYKVFLDELAGLPVSEGKLGIISMVEKQAEAIEKQLQISVFAGVNHVTLRALELAVGCDSAKAVEAEDLGKDQPDDIAPELADDDDLDDDLDEEV